MFYLGAFLHPSMWSRGDTGDKEAWRVYFESSYRGNRKEREWGKEKVRERVEGIAFGGEAGTDIGPCVSAVVNVTNLWCGNNSRWGLGQVQWNYVWLWWAVVKHTHIYSNTFSQVQAVFLALYPIETKPQSSIALQFCYIYIPLLKQSLLKYKILKYVGLKTLHNLLKIFASFFGLKETGSHFALVKRAHKTQPQGQRCVHIQTLLQVFRLKHSFHLGFQGSRSEWLGLWE